MRLQKYYVESNSRFANPEISKVAKTIASCKVENFKSNSVNKKCTGVEFHRPNINAAMCDTYNVTVFSLISLRFIVFHFINNLIENR